MLPNRINKKTLCFLITIASALQAITFHPKPRQLSSTLSNSRFGGSAKPIQSALPSAAIEKPEEELAAKLKGLIAEAQVTPGFLLGQFAGFDVTGILASMPRFDIHCVLTNLSKLSDIFAQIVEAYAKKQWDDLPALLHQFVDTFVQLRHC